MSSPHPLTAYRQRHGLTLEAFGLAVDATKGSVSKWEHGGFPSRTMLERIGRASNGELTPNDFLRPVEAPAVLADIASS